MFDVNMSAPKVKSRPQMGRKCRGDFWLLQSIDTNGISSCIYTCFDRSLYFCLKIDGKFRTGAGKPGEAIIKIAKEENATMIITGTRGLGKIRRTVLGSVSDYVIHHSPIPVLVCRMWFSGVHFFRQENRLNFMIAINLNGKLSL